MNKLTVIDLLNKIANGEKIKCFRCCDNLYIFNPEYESIEEMFYYDEINWISRQDFDLNDEIEIIEDKSNKIERIGISDDEKSLYFDDKYQDISIHNASPLEVAFAIKINEITDYINNMEE